MAVVREPSGVKAHHSLEDLGKITIKRERTHQRSLTTDFTNWRTTNACEYLEGLGWSFPVESGHRVYEFELDGYRYQVPSILLIRAFMRPYPRIAPFLFRPNGLEQICIPNSEGGVSFMPISIETRDKYSDSIQKPLFWMWTRPSAYKMWSSIYDSACDGQLSVDLPIGSVRLSLQGVEAGSSFFVTSLVAVFIETDEPSFGFTKSNPGKIIFHAASNNMPYISEITKHQEVRSGPQEWSLTDAEWQLIEQLQVRTGNHYCRYSARALIDGIIRKLGTGDSWRKSTYKVGGWVIASYTYNRLRRNGQWEQILEILNQTRPT